MPSADLNYSRFERIKTIKCTLPETEMLAQSHAMYRTPMKIYRNAEEQDKVDMTRKRVL